MIDQASNKIHRKPAKTAIKKIATLVKTKPVHVFLAISVFFGLGIALLVPPFQIPDELTHFTRSYEVSRLQTAHPHEINGAQHLGSNLPKSILVTYNATKLRHVAGAPDVPQAQKYSRHQTTYTLHIPLNKNQTTFFDTGSSPNYFPVLYLPQALIIKILSVINAPVIIMLYATRIVGLLIWLFFASYALKLLRRKSQKAALSAILLIPTFVAQASASTDPLINGLALLFVAVVATDAKYKDKPRFRKLVLLVAMLSVMTLSKPVYAAFGLLLFLQPSIRSGLKGTLIKFGAALSPVFVFVLWSIISTISGGPFYADTTVISGAVPGEQIAHVIPNVLNFFEPFMNTLLLGWGDNIYVSLIGEFGKLDTPLPIIFVVLGYILIFIAIFMSPDADKEETYTEAFHAKHKTWIILFVSAALYVIGVFLAMYVYSTPPGVPIITGIQGRYLLPLLPMFALFRVKHIVSIKQNTFHGLMVFMPIALLIASITVIYFRYYTVYP